MISKKHNPVEWALLLDQLDDAREHLESLLDQMVKGERVDDEDYAVQLGHGYEGGEAENAHPFH